MHRPGLPTPTWQNERVEIHQGDSLELLALVPDDSIDAVVTDPPYIIGGISIGNENAKAGTWADMENAAFWFAAWYREVLRILRPDGALWTCLSWRTLPTVMRAAAMAGRPVTSLVVWDKEWIGCAGPQALRPSYECVALITREDFRLEDRAKPDIWRVPWSAHKPSGHPAEKPVELMRLAIEHSSVRTGGVILDPFAGSGTTAVAALERADLRCILMEREAPHVQLAAARVGMAMGQGRLF